jgi:hypothetical protein
MVGRVHSTFINGNRGRGRRGVAGRQDSICGQRVYGSSVIVIYVLGCFYLYSISQMVGFCTSCRRLEPQEVEGA